MRLSVLAVSAVALVVLLTTGAFMNNACKTDRGLWWCAPANAYTHMSMNLPEASLAPLAAAHKEINPGISPHRRNCNEGVGFTKHLASPRSTDGHRSQEARPA
jgi:hypothetical protein